MKDLIVGLIVGGCVAVATIAILFLNAYPYLRDSEEEKEDK